MEYLVDILKDTLITLTSVTWLMITLAILLFAVWYFFKGYTLMCIGRKAKMRPDWKAYVPVMRRVYELRMLGEEAWKLLFFKDIGYILAGVAGLLMFRISYSISNSAAVALNMGALFCIAYAGYTIYTTYRWLRKLYKKFNFNPMIAVMYFVPGINGIGLLVMELFIAYDNSKVFGSKVDSTCKLGTIIGVSGQFKDAHIMVKDGETVVFGRDSSQCNLVFDQTSMDVSGVHCRIAYNGLTDTYTVVDRSKNGTFTAGGHRLQPGMPVPLPKGTEIYLASNKNSFRLN